MRITCDCGRELSAEPTQAGLKILCTCGRTVQVPSWRRSLDAAEGRLPEPGRSRLTALGWTFLLLAIAGVVVGSLATDALRLETGPSRKFLRMLLGGGALLVVIATAAVFRVLGARFFRD